MNKRIAAWMFVAVAAAVAGCAPSLSGGAYSREQVRKEQTVRLGVVQSVRPVTIEGTKTPVGAAAGAAVGGIAGSEIGHGRGAAVGAIGGAVLGGLAGAAAEEALTRRPGLEITVKLDHGGLIAVTQEADERFEPGDRVRVVSGGGVTRVTH
ncbi:glycine zipper 2TM domain-containing protein [Pelomicrobium methylotrophicum]|uniref:Glycine zipper 2TM domain-containing protein n=1 Tax=Pelomicrobium methylotrophicum TaxID=2602750 RepID=A0A5C7EZ07_9PROT|nr:glycine zipper 2TM domain-containing protein [Pelomicrobium methylotrophicum]TXF12546.1 glycine zipper 2TM domain-containing protein [Pelomicrobium methylotrophicum]